MSGVLKTINVHVFMARYVRTELEHHSAYRGTIVYSSSHIGAMSLSLAVIYFIWFGHIPRLSQQGGTAGYFTCSNCSLLPNYLRGEFRRGGPHRVVEYPVIVLILELEILPTKPNHRGMCEKRPPFFAVVHKAQGTHFRGISF
jgi:hypothetical protein